MLIRPSGRSTDFITPSFGYGCLYNCSYCYMKRHRAEGLTVATNTGDILTAINNHAYFTPVEIDKLNKLADHVILVGHLKDKVVDKKGTEVVVKDLDLTGKLKQITCSRADAIGYISRDKGETIISFDSLLDVTGGTRCPHLIGKTMPLVWSNIFID